jgi:hypothetical protein
MTDEEIVLESLDDGVKQTGGDLRVADVAVLLAESLDCS